MEVLYDPEERAKLEWSIGAIFTGDAKHIQKFIVLYGEAGSGKSTFLNLVQALFEGYYSVFDAKELASSNNSFALESFKNGPLVSIQHDGDLSRIEDNTKLNSIVSHESMEVNEKFKSKYIQRFDTFLYMGTNRPVRITEAKSGLLRRLIDVSPSGRRISYERYTQLVNGISYELGAIAYYCIQRYKEMGESYYDKYVPTRMISATNDFYDFVEDNYDDFLSADFVTLSEAWRRYREYCDFAKVAYPFTMRAVRTELKNYFREYKSQAVIDGRHLRNVYSKFIYQKFEFESHSNIDDDPEEEQTDDDIMDAYSLIPDWLDLKPGRSIFDEFARDFPAQYSRRV
jgi:phage/plasmid-associated DNA primase